MDGALVMTKRIDFYFDFVSPTAYVAWKRLPGVLERTGATLNAIPMFLGGVMNETGNRPPFTVPAKGRYFSVDLARFIHRYQIPFTMNAAFPLNTLPLLRAVSTLHGTPEFQVFCDAIFDKTWKEGANVGDPEIALAALNAAGLNGQALFAAASSDAAKEAVKSQTAEAVARGVFGAPTFFVGDEMYFGQDRLDWVEEAVAA
jgi:2-hydroxychromene-2-carboxylate isomerase